MSFDLVDLAHLESELLTCLKGYLTFAGLSCMPVLAECPLLAILRPETTCRAEQLLLGSYRRPFGSRAARHAYAKDVTYQHCQSTSLQSTQPHDWPFLAACCFFQRCSSACSKTCCLSRRNVFTHLQACVAAVRLPRWASLPLVCRHMYKIKQAQDDRTALMHTGR